MGFSREEAWQVAMATFCTNKIIGGKLIKMGTFLTLDKQLHDRYIRHSSEIKTHFNNMLVNLKLPYSDSTLPGVLLVNDLIVRIAMEKY